MNCFLRSFDLPSILLRHPGEKAVDESAYSIAIAHIDISREPLIELIKKRIIDARIQPFSDSTIEQLVRLRIELSEVARRIQQKKPTFDIELITSKVMLNTKVYSEAEELAQTDINAAQVVIAKEMLKIGLCEEKKLDAQLKAPAFCLGKISPLQRDVLLLNLLKLSEQTGWKVNETNGLITFLECSDRKLAETITSKLSSANFAEVSLMRRADNQEISVIKCEKVNLLKLTTAASAIFSKAEDAPTFAATNK